MADLLPSIPETSGAEEADPRVVDLAGEDAEEVIGALSSSTARELFAALTDDPAHPSALAEEVDTSLQNAQYHLSNLEDAGIVEVVDTAYSEKGREMDIYAPADRPLVVFAGDEEDGSLLRSALERLLGGWAILAAVAAAVQGLFGDGESLLGGSTLFGAEGGSGGASGEAARGEEFDSSGGGSDQTAGGDGGDSATGDGSGDYQTTADDAGGSGGADGADGGERATDVGVEITEQSEPAVEAVGTVADDLSWLGDALATGGLEPGAAVLVFGSFLLLGAVGTWYVRQR